MHEPVSPAPNASHFSAITAIAPPPHPPDPPQLRARRALAASRSTVTPTVTCSSFVMLGTPATRVHQHACPPSPLASLSVPTNRAPLAARRRASRGASCCGLRVERPSHPALAQRRRRAACVAHATMSCSIASVIATTWRIMSSSGSLRFWMVRTFLVVFWMVATQCCSCFCSARSAVPRASAASFLVVARVFSLRLRKSATARATMAASCSNSL
mmetsp:Transcript_27765/g.73485  ORF Transcript_27765/g.73485 Transcript_27765/m.73485 type:complete len:215 (+) Transcript_27765:49-693(+)